MNVLSMLSIAICACFWMVGYEYIRKFFNLNTRLWMLLMVVSLGWWSFCDAFFFSAATQGQAWFWHRASSLGWSTFQSFSCAYFVSYTKNEYRFRPYWKAGLMACIPVILVIYNLFSDTTCVALKLVPSQSGFGWSYVSNISSPWYWFFLLQMLFFFGITFYVLGNYYRKTENRVKRIWSGGFIILNAVVIFIGVMTDMVLPLYSDFLPPVGNLVTGIFLFAYLIFLSRYDMINIGRVFSADVVWDISMDPIFLLDVEGEVLRCNPAACLLLGYEKKEIVGKNFSDFLLTGKLNADIFRQLTSQKIIKNRKSILKKPDGERQHVLLSASLINDQKQKRNAVVILVHDVTELLQAQASLEEHNAQYRELAEKYYRLSYYDQLTRLPNRRSFFQTLENRKRSYEDNQVDFAVVYIDLDGFKQINDIYGHKMGDALLIFVAQNLLEVMRGKGIASRMGGDEFTCIVSGEDVRKTAESVTAQIHERFRDSIILEGKKCNVGVSVGYGIYSEWNNIEKLVQQADTQMYDSKFQKKSK